MLVCCWCNHRILFRFGIGVSYAGPSVQVSFTDSLLLSAPSMDGVL